MLIIYFYIMRRKWLEITLFTQAEDLRLQGDWGPRTMVYAGGSRASDAGKIGVRGRMNQAISAHTLTPALSRRRERAGVIVFYSITTVRTGSLPGRGLSLGEGR